MFDRIAHRYDLLNRLLSCGQDIRWRNKIVKNLPQNPELNVLDLASGTADVLITIANKNKNFASGIGLDMAQKMLTHGRRKIHDANLSSKISLLPADASFIPLQENLFDAVTMSFGIRNVLDVPQTLGEILRVLKKGGRALILEFSLPSLNIIKYIYLFYFRYILPKLGGLISGDYDAYQYLNESVETFPYGDAFCELMRKAGFKNVWAIPLTFGIATLYIGEKLD